MRDPEEQCQSFVQIWAEAVLRQVEQVRATRKKFKAYFRAAERGDNLIPDEVLAENARMLWAVDHTLVWTAYQLERWTRRLAVERGSEPPPPDAVLADLRNALEHLDDADFSGHHVVAGEGRSNRSLRRLPQGRLALHVGDGLAFGLIDPNELESRALAEVHAIEDELDQAAADWYAEMMQGR